MSFSTLVLIHRIFKNSLFTSKLANGNKLIHTAINTHNVHAIDVLMKLSKGQEANEKWSEGLSALDLARLRDNPEVLIIFNITNSWSPDELLEKIKNGEKIITQTSELSKKEKISSNRSNDSRRSNRVHAAPDDKTKKLKTEERKGNCRLLILQFD